MTTEHAGLRVQVSDYPGAAPGMHILVTLGLTHYRDQLLDVTEVVVPTSELDAVVIEAVTASVGFLLRLEVPIEGVSYLRHLHRSVPAFFGRYGKSAFAFMAPSLFPDDFARVPLGASGQVGNLWMGFFLSDPEVQFIEQEGFGAFLALLEAQGVDVSDLQRPSAV